MIVKMKITILNHPLVEHKLSILRDEKTSTKEFREIASELTIFLCYEAMRDANLDEVTIKTPLTEAKAKKLNEDQYAFIPILRAGLSMVEGIIRVIPNAKIGHIGLYRNEENLKPVQYYFKVPKDIQNREVILLDPMVATGGSAVDAVSLIKAKGVKKIKFLSIISAPEGIQKLEENHPDIEFYSTALDDHLNEKGYIVPGLGDAGDRIFGTK